MIITILMNFKLSVSLILLFALTLSPIGCATSPETDKPAAKAAIDALAEKNAAVTEQATAKAAMDKAISSDAEKYAAADLDVAKIIWETAEARMKEEKYVEAKQSYVAARAAFDKATATATVEEGKKVAATEANAAVANLEKAWENLKAAANNVKKKIKDKEMRDDWAAFTKTFTEDIKATKQKIVTDPAGAKANIDELMSIIERWNAAFKELLTPPKPKATKSEAKPSKTTKK